MGPLLAGARDPVTRVGATFGALMAPWAGTPVAKDAVAQIRVRQTNSSIRRLIGLVGNPFSLTLLFQQVLNDVA